MKFKMLVTDDIGGHEFVDLYIKESEIIGFYLPSDYNEFSKDVLNVIFKGGSILSLQSDEELRSYLDRKLLL